MSIQHVKNSPWIVKLCHGNEYLELVLNDTPRGKVVCTIQLRPHYCDRGHLMLLIDGMLDIDASDSFPRYFFNFDEADRHCRDFLLWRLYKLRNYSHELYPKHRKGSRVRHESN